MYIYIYIHPIFYCSTLSFTISSLELLVFLRISDSTGHSQWICSFPISDLSWKVTKTTDFTKPQASLLHHPVELF